MEPFISPEGIVFLLNVAELCICVQFDLNISLDVRNANTKCIPVAGDFACPIRSIPYNFLRDKQNIYYALCISLLLNLSTLDTQCIQIHWLGHFEVSCLNSIFLVAGLAN